MMPRPPFLKRASIRVGVICLVCNGLIADGAPPLWWFDPSSPVVIPNSLSDSENNHAVANIGQAKWMTKSALEALRLVLPTVASQIDGDLATIVDFTVPATPDAEWREKQRAPLLIGQLKAMAAPFYTRLNAVAPTWLVTQLQINGVFSVGSHFPWTTTSDDDSNRSVATVGQLKAVFGLRLDVAPSDTADTDGDGLSDVDEGAEGTSPLIQDNKAVKLNVTVIPN